MRSAGCEGDNARRQPACSPLRASVISRESPASTCPCIQRVNRWNVPASMFVPALVVGDDRTDLFDQGRAGRFDRDTKQHRSRRIFDEASHAACLLRPRGGLRDERTCEHQQTYRYETYSGHICLHGVAGCGKAEQLATPLQVRAGIIADGCDVSQPPGSIPHRGLSYGDRRPFVLAGLRRRVTSAAAPAIPEKHAEFDLV